MPELPVGEATIWALASSVVGAIMAWLIRLERRMGSVMTREEHGAICERKHVEMKCDLDEIKNMLERQNDRSEVYRNRVSSSLKSLDRRLVSVQTRMGDKMSAADDSGTYKSGSE